MNLSALLNQGETLGSTQVAYVGGTASNSANLRSSATTDSITLQQLPIGARVEIITQNAGKAVNGDTVWFYVLGDGGASGYLHNSVLQRSKPNPSTGSRRVPVSPIPKTPPTPNYEELFMEPQQKTKSPLPLILLGAVAFLLLRGR